MEAIMAIAAKHKLYVIEDNAQAIGASLSFSDGSRKKSGTIGHIASTSFFPSKNLGCYGDGGALFTNDADLAKKMRRVCNHGSDVRYYHEVVGVNSRLDAMQAADPAHQTAAPGRVRIGPQQGRRPLRPGVRRDAARRRTSRIEGQHPCVPPVHVACDRWSSGRSQKAP